MSSHNTSHWAQQADAIQHQMNEPLGVYREDEQDREETPDETARNRLLGLLGPGDVMRRRVVCVRPGMPIYEGDTIISGGCRLTVTDGVPRDAKIVNVFSDPLRYPLSVHVVFEHESFDWVPEGAHIPYWCPSYTIEAEWVSPKVQSDVARTYPE